MRWFLTQEVAGEAGFDDLLALTQVKMPVQAKLEMARNFWDEMGRGDSKGMHGPHAGAAGAAISTSIRRRKRSCRNRLALGNMMVGLARNRRYAFQSIGALGVIEMTAPTRAGYVDRALAPPRRAGEEAALFRAPRRSRRQAFRGLEPRGAAAAGRRGSAPRARDRRRRGAAALARRALLRALPPGIQILRRTCSAAA